MKIKLNGEDKIIGIKVNLSEFLEKELNVEDSKGIAVAINLSIVPRSKWESTQIKENDEIEIVHAVQGG
jgi:sulfur carrier protein